MVKFKETNEEVQIMLAEYQAAQSSAEHYNTMTWTLLSLILAYSLLILKTILLDINSTGWQFSLFGKYSIINSILLSGTLAWLYFGYLIQGADEKKKIKYNISKKIEKKFNFLGNNGKIKEGIGLKLFIIVKNSFIVLFVIISILTIYRALDGDNWILTAIISVINQVLCIFNIFYDLNRMAKFKLIKINYSE